MFKFVQCLLILTSVDGAHTPAVRDDATYRSEFPSKSAYPQEVSHFDSRMSVDDMKEGVTAHDEGKKEDDFSLATTKEDEEGLRDASAATMAPEAASTTVGIALSDDINGPEMVGNPSQFIALSEGVGICTRAKPRCMYSPVSKICKCFSDHFVAEDEKTFKKLTPCSKSRPRPNDECDHTLTEREKIEMRPGSAVPASNRDIGPGSNGLSRGGSLQIGNGAPTDYGTSSQDYGGQAGEKVTRHKGPQDSLTISDGTNTPTPQQSTSHAAHRGGRMSLGQAVRPRWK